MAIYAQEFPFAELKTPTGDYYDTRTQMEQAGFEKTQMWSITDIEQDDGSEYFCYGPVHHYVNLVGYIATAEHHNGDTYYIECIRTAEQVAAAAAYFCEECDD